MYSIVTRLDKPGLRMRIACFRLDYGWAGAKLDRSRDHEFRLLIKEV